MNNINNPVLYKKFIFKKKPKKYIDIASGESKLHKTKSYRIGSFYKPISNDY